MKRTVKVKERLEQYLNRHREALDKKRNYLVNVVEEALQTDKAIEYIFDNYNDYLKLRCHLKFCIYNAWKNDLDELFVINFKIYLDNNLVIEVISKNSLATEIKITQDLPSPVESNNLVGVQRIVSPNPIQTILEPQSSPFREYVPNRSASLKLPNSSQERSEREAQLITRIKTAQAAVNEAAAKLMSRTDSKPSNDSK